MADHLLDSTEIVDYEGDNTQMHQQELVVPATLISMAESFEKKGHSWFVVSQLPSDLSIKLDDITFHVNKYPLVSRCGYLQQIDLQTSASNDGYEMKLENFPGGAETFEVVVKFCYGLSVSLNPRNVAYLRCAAEFLDMTEELEDGNLISKTESFLTFVVFSSWKDSITVLKSCKNLFPWAENLQIVRRCCDSIAWASQETASAQRRWLNDVSTLHIDHFKRIITSMTLKGTRPEFLGSCIMIYAEKWLLGNDVEIEGLKHHTNGKNELVWSIYNGQKKEKESGNQSQEQRVIIETLVSILPHQKDAVSCRFLLWMLKMAMVYSVSPALVSELEKRVGMVMENASVYDLLIPAEGNQLKSLGEQTMYNVDSVQRILEYYLMNEQQRNTGTNGKSNISKLLDNYLAEIAGDPNLSATKFQVIAELLPEAARPCDDGLYRAIDIYLKAHPELSDHDRRRLCRVMNCQKLSVDACSHASQNDRLPVRTVLQVLFAEQVKLRETIQEKQQTTNADQEDNWSSQKEEIKMLKAELEKMMVIIEEIQTDHTNLQQDCKTIRTKQNALSGWILGWNKIKKTSLFHSKLNGNENREGKGEKRISSMLRTNRRQSVG
uniref:BTB/POZ domain-containing protein DOT3 isoform X2 n=1 Tax=Erigeron canadensis TaxID=72917 RepID=UPI001CB98067|nr:BTB/POZ domain-containing protein DOT3 isoform X2 [Erigeron canadensis]